MALRVRLFILIGLLGTATHVTPQTKVIGHERLVSIEPLPDAGGEICEPVPVTRKEMLLAALEQRQEAHEAAKAAPAGRSAATEDRSRLKPVRWIRDPYAAYSSVAVDPINNEVVMTDENLFQILVYDRTTTTPPSARLSEPKRIIAGLNTKIEFQCGLYIDPKNGNIYAVNNDTVDTLVIFDRNA